MDRFRPLKVSQDDAECGIQECSAQKLAWFCNDLIFIRSLDMGQGQSQMGLALRLPMRNIGIEELLMAPALAVVFLILSWPYCRSINLGQPLNAGQKKMILYGFWYVLGMGYVIIIPWKLRLSGRMYVPFILAWGVLLAIVAWWRHKRQTTPEARGTEESISKLKLGMPLVGLLVCLVASAIEWEFVIKKEGHLVGSLLWTGGVAAMIALARRNRRTTVVTALRSFLSLLIIGASTQQSLVPLIAAVVIGVGLFLLERLWKKEEPSEIHLNFSGD